MQGRVRESLVPELGWWGPGSALLPHSQGSFARAASFMVYCGLMSPFLPCAPGVSGNWIEIAYGTSSGAVRVIVQHPETVGSGPQLFQTFTVHRSPVTKIMLSEKHLVSGKGRVPAGEEAARRTVPGDSLVSQTGRPAKQPCAHS